MDRATATTIATRVLAPGDLARWRESERPELDALDALREYVFGPVRLPKLDKIKPGEVIAAYRGYFPNADFVDESRVFFGVRAPLLRMSAWLHQVPTGIDVAVCESINRLATLLPDARQDEYAVRVHCGWIDGYPEHAIEATGLYLRLRAAEDTVILSREWSLDLGVAS